MAKPQGKLRFWGVRGSIPTPVPDNLRYGGNTSCLALALSDREHLILDCGAGIRMLGAGLAPNTPEAIEHLPRLIDSARREAAARTE